MFSFLFYVGHVPDRINDDDKWSQWIRDCQKQFQFLPVSYLIDIRTTKFLEKFASSENLICSLFTKQATETHNNILKIW